VVEMQYAADLADPLLDVRDVVESFRSHQVIPADWDETIRRAMGVLSQLPPQARVDTRLPGLLPDLGRLLGDGFGNSPLVDRIARQVANALDETPVPGIPAPEDDDWSFGEVSAS
jgi:hypothetical protein